LTWCPSVYALWSEPSGMVVLNQAASLAYNHP
jgi:hypothetical protein